ncbi:apolipoprotein L3-like [Monodelphis domestica]|uniref:apolipoprotein L3-like n=1 Tax=Monodelphis domestica TaxID=13616 RepID=UPI0000F2E3A9|nr:apolipoprotein L3-like [Monodelphis domestica]XP_056654853.1 apolipoprotein L3-like [Monodelphis domestica]XP_056654854.1 apolipoprotein L3-like [Monodelphis domestica]XP_056654856.1 apolipoprotein L3-like [Monodelphis domestica]XP_056654857.1 apolipoprotein L3-like [Monodelphis domestica]XP_056654858.1 apolipoprotein L3-like [Monodelphis domestica]XP_056654859.1 apolipoprotein L3-like [Monodelphis domestica]XP_056654860.1 apolipoprotein L3-like [Monodelphis domestica]XP_056654861.1 apol
MESLEDPDKITDDPDKITGDPDKITGDINENMAHKEMEQELDMLLTNADDLKKDNDDISSYGEAFDNLEEFYEYMVFQEMQEELDTFSSEFPRVKPELENFIHNLYSKADRFDKIHDDCSVVLFLICAIGAFSSIMSVVGITLEPINETRGRALCLIGLGMGTVVIVIGIFTGFIDHSGDLQEREFFSELERDINVNIPEENSNEEEPKLFSRLQKYNQIFKDVQNRCKEFQLGKTNPPIIEVSRGFMSGTRFSGKNSRQLSLAVQRTLAMSKGAKIRGATLSGAFSQVDAINIAKAAMDLSNATITEKMRKIAQALEKNLQALSNYFEKLQRMDF